MMFKNAGKDSLSLRDLHRGKRSLLLLILIGLLIYANAVLHPFVHDDVVFIAQNPNIARWDNIHEAFLKPGIPFQSLRITTPYYRPVLEVFYRFEYLLFGMNPYGFHLFNVILHILNALLVFFVIHGCRVRRSWSLLGAFLFLVHPIQSEAVACVSGISNLAVTFFLLLSFLSYIRSRYVTGTRSVGRFCLSLASFVLALFTKEQAVVLPFLILMYELTRRVKTRAISQRIVPLSFFFVLTAAYLGIRSQLFPGFLTITGVNNAEFFLRILSIPGTLLMYLGIVFWPADLHYYRSMDILAPWWPGFVGSMCLIAAIGWMSTRMPMRYRRQAIFGIGWFLIGLLPALNIVPLINEYSLVLAAEHFLYLPLAGLLIACMAIIAFLARGLKREFTQQKAALAVLLIAILGIMTVGQNRFWRAEIPLFERTVRFEPGLGRVHLLLAKAYANERRFSEALREYSLALQIMTGYVSRAQDASAREVYRHFQKTIHFDQGQCYFALGRLKESAQEYEEALSVSILTMSPAEIEANDSMIANQLAMVYLFTGDRPAARKYFQRAVVISPKNFEALNNLGMFSFEEKDPALARFFFTRSLKIAPGFPLAIENLKRLAVSQ